jgi:hypothetical protein
VLGVAALSGEGVLQARDEAVEDVQSVAPVTVRREPLQERERL